MKDGTASPDTDGVGASAAGDAAAEAPRPKRAAAGKPRKKVSPLKLRQTRFIVTFLALPVALYVWLVIMPFAQAFQISLTDWSGVSPTFDYIGFDNYVRIMSDDLRTIPGFLHTGVILVVLPPIVIALALFFAFMVNVGGQGRGGRIAGVRGSAFYKVVYFFPQVLSLAIIAIIWIQMYAPTATGGIITSGLQALGLPYPPNGILMDKSYVLTGVIAVMIWGAVGFYLVYFSSAMAGIPHDLYEAAIIDGAGRFKTFFKITLPLLWESVQTAWVYLGILALDGFVLVYIMTPNQGGPNHASEVIGGVIYYHAFGAGVATGPGRGAGYASAIGVVLFFVVLVITIVGLRITRRERVEY